MKYALLAVALVAGICLVQAETNVANSTALFSAVGHVKDDLETFTNQQLEKSFDFLLLSSAFDQHNLDRPGFEKLYRKISDKAWEDTQKLIKYRSKRGLTVELNGLNDAKNALKQTHAVTRAALLGTNEIDSLKVALNYEKVLAEESHSIHKKISHAHGKDEAYDPDVAHYLDEEIIEYQSGVIRELAGHIHILKSIQDESATAALGTHLFDEYLAKAL